MKIGDKVPPYDGFDPDLARQVIRNRGKLERRAARPAQNIVNNSARKALAIQGDKHFRATDPFEQAKLHLGRLGFQVFAVAILRPGEKGYIVGKRIVANKEAVLKIAERHGWNRP